MSDRKSMFLSQLTSRIPLEKLMFYQRYNNNVTDQTGTYGTTSSGITYANGLYSGGANESVVLDALTDSIHINSTADFSFVNGSVDSDFSVSFVFNATNLGVLSGTFRVKLFICNRSSASDSAQKVWQISTNDSSSPKLSFYFFDQSTGGSKIATCETILSNNVTYHAGLTFSKSKGITIYLNGIAQPITLSTNGTYISKEVFSNNIRIGNGTWDNNNGLLGKMDGLGIWNVALNKRQVKAIYDKQASGLEIL